MKLWNKKYWIVVVFVAMAFFVFWLNARQKQAIVSIAVPSAQINTESAKVLYVIDGDTVILGDGRHVRYIGMDTPELKRADNNVSEEENNFAIKARDVNRALVEGKAVMLEKDVEEFDKYGRTLAYVWVDGKMANEEMLKTEWAKLMTIPPNLKYAERLKAVTISRK